MIRLRASVLFAVSSAILSIAALRLCAAPEPASPVSSLIGELQAGLPVYYTPQALACFATDNGDVPSSRPADRDSAARTLKACMKIAGLPFAQASPAVPALIDLFPRAIHVVQVRQASYNGEGSFDDCVSTYVTTARNQFLYAPPFAGIKDLSMCGDFIDESHETRFIEKKTDGRGGITGAVFDLQITYTFYAGEYALSMISGMALGHQPVAWRQWWQETSAGQASYAVVPAVRADPSPAPLTVSTGATCDLLLSTGNELSGKVVDRTDSSMTLLTAEGKPYVIPLGLVKSCRVVASAVPIQAQESAHPQGGEIVAWEELKNRAVSNPFLEIETGNGAVMRGRLLSMNDRDLTVSLGGASNTVSRGQVSRITVLQQPSGGVFR